MSKFSIKVRLALLTAGVVLGLSSFGCGSASNNDQGTSFLALGFFQDTTGTIGETGTIVPLFTDVADPTLGGGDGRSVITFLGLQNRIETQFIRVIRVDCRYDIEGSNLQIPDDSFTFSTVLGEVGSETPGAIGYAGFEIISPDIFAFLNVNQNSLPQLPFRMTVACTAVGTTQAGDTLTTNEVYYFVQFVDFAECCTGDGNTPGFQTGPGSGGDIEFTDTTEDDGEGEASGLVSGSGLDGDEFGDGSGDDFVIE